MKPITMSEFAKLCWNDPGLHEQTEAIPNALTPDKVFALAAHNGYRIIPEQESLGKHRMEPLVEAALDTVSGGIDGMTEEEKWNELHIWMYHIVKLRNEYFDM